LSNDSTEKELVQTIIQVIKGKEPQTVKQLAGFVKERVSVGEREIVELILKLQGEGKITLEKPLESTPQNLISYLKTGKACWYWITITLAATATIVAFVVPENSFPLVYIRYLLGAIFVLWLPGYSVIKALFSTEEKNEKSSGNLDSIERVAISIGLSLALVPMVGLLLNYTPWGIRLTPIVLSLFVLTAFFSTVAVVREHRTRIKASK
jgi:Na+/melibiose symporter-like transporter